MFNHIFNSKTKTVTFAAIILGISSLISGLLGLVRDRLLAGYFGASPELDVYFAAFRIPDAVYGILIAGGMAMVFLPIFSDYFDKDQKEAWRFANIIINCFLFFLVIFSVNLFVLTPAILNFITPGFSIGQRELTADLSRILFLSPILLGLSGIFSSILHYFNRFLAYSLAPVFYNLGIIFGIVFFLPNFGLYGLIFGVILGVLLHLFIQLPAVFYSGFHYQAIFDFNYPGLKKIFSLIVPRIVSQVFLQSNTIIITAIASTLASGSIAIFNFANNLQSLPVGIIGASFAVASFPALSSAWVNGQKEKFLPVLD